MRVYSSTKAIPDDQDLSEESRRDVWARCRRRAGNRPAIWMAHLGFITGSVVAGTAWVLLPALSDSVCVLVAIFLYGSVWWITVGILRDGIAVRYVSEALEEMRGELERVLAEVQRRTEE